MKRTKKFNVASPSKAMSKDQLRALILEGEKLGDNLMTQLSEYGSSVEGLIIETYSVCKALAALTAVADSRNIEIESMFNKFFPMFLKETEEELKKLGLK